MISVGLVTQLGGPCGVMKARVSGPGGRRNQGEKQVKAFVSQVLDKGSPEPCWCVQIGVRRREVQQQVQGESVAWSRSLAGS
jgi:hypothetical protein